MQLNIKKYESINIYVLLHNNVIIGMYNTFEDANAAQQILQNKHKELDDWIKC